MNEHEMDYQNPEHLRERADAIEADKAGRPVEFFDQKRGLWAVARSPLWISCVRYRPAPEPKPKRYVPWTRETLLALMQKGPVIVTPKAGTPETQLLQIEGVDSANALVSYVGWLSFANLSELWQQANGDLCGTLEEQA